MAGVRYSVISFRNFNGTYSLTMGITGYASIIMKIKIRLLKGKPVKMVSAKDRESLI